MPRTKLYRVKDPKSPCAMVNPTTGRMEVPNPAIPYREDDPMVKAHPWYFTSDSDFVEEASANPGEKRRVGRPPLPRSPGPASE